MLDLFEDLAAVLPGKVQVQQDEVWARTVSELALLEDVAHRLLAVPDHRELVRQLRFAQDLPRQLHVCRAVLHEKVANRDEACVSHRRRRGPEA